MLCFQMCGRIAAPTVEAQVWLVPADAPAHRQECASARPTREHALVGRSSRDSRIVDGRAW
jgi:hypothetical protein